MSLDRVKYRRMYRLRDGDLRHPTRQCESFFHRPTPILITFLREQVHSSVHQPRYFNLTNVPSITTTLIAGG